MYSAPITRRRKALFVLLIDNSGSMDEKILFAGTETTKSKAVALTANMMIDEIINRSRRGDGVSDYCDIAALGYSADNVVSLLGNTPIRSVCDLAVMPYRTEKHFVRRTLPDGRETEAVIERKFWFEPAAKGSTPLNKALCAAEKLIRRWAKRHPTSFPPIVINITDGEASDADPEEIIASAERIKSLTTDDGATLLININLACGYDSPVESVKYPSADEPLPDNRYTRLLYRTSSTLPEFYNDAVATLKNGRYSPPYKALCFNCSADELLIMLNIGSASIDRII